MSVHVAAFRRSISLTSMEPFAFDFDHTLEHSCPAQLSYPAPSVNSYALSAYDELSAMMPFMFQGCLQAPTQAQEDFQRQLDPEHSFSLGSRPIAIPLPSSNNNFHVAQPSLTSSPYSSSPFTPSPYVGSPAISQSSFSVGGGSAPGNNDLGSFQMVTAPVMTYQSPAGYSLEHAASTPTPLLTGSALGKTQCSSSEKPSRSFDCKRCGKLFTRLADVKRHETSVHDPVPIDCPVDNCVRKGSIGFPRRDHLMEHLRTFHNKDIPKRSGNKKRKVSAIL